MTILAQELLLNNSIMTLKTQHGIKSSAKPGDVVFGLNYDQIESKPGPVVNQCRGVILRAVRPLTEEQISGSEPVGPTTICARPFDRFFNHGDTNADEVDFNHPSTRFYEKLDGTCCIVWWNSSDQRWNIATRSVPFADKPMSGWHDMTFADLFKKALRETLVRYDPNWSVVNEELCFKLWTKDYLDTRVTYVLELTTPMNRIVVEYKEYTVWLLGARNTETGVELGLEEFDEFFAGVPCCPSYKLNDMESVLAFVGSKPPFEQEGLVVCDHRRRRVKMKSLAYSAYNRVRDSSANSPRALMELILCEKLDDVFPVLEPHIQKEAIKLQDGARALFQSVDPLFLELSKSIEGSTNRRKDFALAIQARNPRLMAYFMDRFQGKCDSFQGWINTKKNAEGSLPDSFVESLITLCNTFS